MSITESYDPTTALVAPAGEGSDITAQLEMAAGPLLGGLDALVNKFFHVSPLTELIRPISGDWEALGKASEAWKSASAATKGVSGNYEALPAQTTEAWTGDAADAFRARMASIAEGHGKYATACDQMSQLANGLCEVAKSTANVIAIVIGFIGSILERLVVEAAIPVIGWIGGAVDIAVHAKEFWDKMNRGYRAVKSILEAVETVIDALNAVANVMNVMRIMFNFASGALTTAAAGDAQGAVANQFGVQ